MVKGVNKTVIEVNNTGSRIFEKIVFYVSPQYGNLSPKKLQRAAHELSFRFNETGTYTLRKRYKNRLRKRTVIAAVLSAAAVISLVLIFLL